MADPITILAMSACMVMSPHVRTGRRSQSTAASISYSTTVGMPTGAYPIGAIEEIENLDLGNGFDVFTEAMGVQELALAVFGNSRSLASWEQEALDEFTWSELEA